MHTLYINKVDKLSSNINGNGMEQTCQLTGTQQKSRYGLFLNLVFEGGAEVWHLSFSWVDNGNFSIFKILPSCENFYIFSLSLEMELFKHCLNYIDFGDFPFDNCCEVHSECHSKNRISIEKMLEIRPSQMDVHAAVTSKPGTKPCYRYILLNFPWVSCNVVWVTSYASYVSLQLMLFSKLCSHIRRSPPSNRWKQCGTSRSNERTKRQITFTPPSTCYHHTKKNILSI